MSVPDLSMTLRPTDEFRALLHELAPELQRLNQLQTEANRMQKQANLQSKRIADLLADALRGSVEVVQTSLE